MSLISRYKNTWPDNDKETHFSKKKYRPYNRRIQKKEDRFDQDWYYIFDQDSERSIFTGINKQMGQVDYKLWYDSLKDGN